MVLAPFHRIRRLFQILFILTVPAVNVPVFYRIHQSSYPAFFTNSNFYSAKKSSITFLKFTVISNMLGRNASICGI